MNRVRRKTLDAIVDWYLALRAGEDMRMVTTRQIEAFAGPPLPSIPGGRSSTIATTAPT